MAFPEGARVVRLSPGHIFKPFDCGDDDLNSFLLNDSIEQQENLFSVTYIIENETETIAFFTLLNDKVVYTEEEISKNAWKKRVGEHVPYEKRGFESFPAMKIGRFGVTSTLQKSGIGRTIIDYIKTLFVTNNRTGCRFITVDAYKDSIGFYKKNLFDFFPPISSEDEVEDDDTALMFYDLTRNTPSTPVAARAVPSKMGRDNQPIAAEANISSTEQSEKQ